MATNFGLRDIPIEKTAQESLGLQHYAKALTTFIQQCQTPMTIAIQGDWGCGKTSMMNLIKGVLGEANYRTVWFNTWQYSQFNLSNNLPILIITHLVNEIEETDSKRVKQVLGGILKATAIGLGSMIGQGNAVKEGVEVFNSDKDPAKMIIELKDELKKLIADRIKKDSKDRIIIFIDDLDRLKPVKAVELLETMKMFLDIEGCVFVLAVDYQVVVQGLKEKFGVSEAELKGKSFFDKIIQVPFNMPLDRYDVDKYFKDLLTSIDIKFEDGDIEIYRDLVMKSVGFNPRSMKRLFNSLLLLKLVIEESAISEKDSKRHENLRIIFAILCMQLQYPILYRYISNVEKFTEDTFKLALEEEKQELENEVVRFEKDNSRDRLSEDEIREKVDNRIRRYEDFLETFYRAIQLKSDGKDEVLTESEIRNLMEILELSSIVGTNEDRTQKKVGKVSKNVFTESQFKETFTKLFDLFEDYGVKPNMRSKGFSLQNKAGKSFFHCYPHKKSSFLSKALSKDSYFKLRDFLKENCDHDLEKGKTYPFMINEIEVTKLAEILRVLSESK